MLLKLLSTLQPGETIHVKSMSKQYHDYYSTSVYRWMSGESRHQLVYMLETSIVNRIKELEVVMDYEKFLELEECIHGLENLTITYSSDMDIIQRIQNCNDLIRRYSFYRRYMFSKGKFIGNTYNIQIINDETKDIELQVENSIEPIPIELKDHEYLQQLDSGYDIPQDKLQPLKTALLKIAKESYQISKPLVGFSLLTTMAFLKNVIILFEKQIINHSSRSKIFKFIAPIIIQNLLFPGINTSIILSLLLKVAIYCLP